MGMFDPRYIEQLEDGTYILVLCDKMEGAAKGGGDLPGLRISEEFSSLRDASEYLTTTYQASYNVLLEEHMELSRKKKEAVSLLNMYFEKYGDQREHPEFMTYKD